MKQSEWQSLFDSLPPHLTLKEVARRFKQTYRLTATWARKCGYEAKSGHKLLWTAQRRRQFQRVPWQNIDWRLSNVQIARELGVSREIVRRRRGERNNHK